MWDAWETYFWIAYGIFLVWMIVLWRRAEQRKKAERAAWQAYLESSHRRDVEDMEDAREEAEDE